MHEERSFRENLMIAARNTVAMCIPVAPAYNQPVLREVHKELRLSQTRAGGPAARLALAVWNAHYRYRFPKNKHFAAVEENSYNHMMGRHRSTSKAHRYHVWKAIELYSPRREAMFGQASLFTPEEPQLGTEISPLRHALYKLHMRATKSSRLYLREMLEALMMMDPTHWETEIINVSKAAIAFANWQATSLSPEWAAFEAAMEKAMAPFYPQPFLWELPIGTAMNILYQRSHYRFQATA